jgi:hypothetical protein
MPQGLASKIVSQISPEREGSAPGRVVLVAIVAARGCRPGH